MPASPVTVAVLWTGYRAGPWTCRSLRAAGHRVVGLQPAGVGSGRSAACVRPRACPSPTAQPEHFLRELARICAAEGVDAVMPVDEDAQRLLAQREPDLGGAVVVGPDARQYAMLCDKSGLGGTARAAGVGRPAAVTVSRHGRDGDWPSLPSVVKHRSNAPAPPEVEGVTAVATADERDRAVLRIVGAGLEAVVEERVAGDHWTVHCVRGDDGAFAAVPARIVRAMPRGAGMPSVFRADPDAGARAADAARRLLEAAGYRGPANVQLFERDGELLVHDVNLRPPASVALAIRAGLDLPALGLAAALGRPWGRLLPAPQPGVRYVSLVDELRAMRGSARRGPSPSRWAVARDLVSACISRRHVLDPPPHDLFWVPQTLGAAARAQARRLLGRR